MLTGRNTPALVTSLALAAALCMAAGCKSGSASQYVSPRVTGRVLEMESGQPLKNVQVRRVLGDANARSPDAPSGGQLLEQKSGTVRTGADGRFEMASSRTLSVLGSGWYSVTLSFQRTGFQSVIRTYTLANSTNSPSGEPVVQTGDVLLPRMEK
jgi:hypothetical protein